jgi:cysteine-rich repeat protein
MRGDCNFLPSAATDPKGRYGVRVAKALASIAGACTGDPVLANYPGGIEADLLDAIAEEIGGSSQVNLGDDDLLCDNAKVACRRAIAQARTAVLKKVLNASVKCQRVLDNVTGTFGEIDPACVADGGTAEAAATNRIVRACAGLTGDDVGSCSPLPGCVIDSAVLTGQGLARAVYATPPTCGNGALDGGEQCDDGDVVPGDGCNAACESEGDTCTPYGGPGGATGTRVVKVSIATPEPLAGLQVTVDYPQFLSGIPGSGTSSVVQGRFTPLQSAGLALLNDTGLDATVGMVDVVDLFDAGDLFQIDFDNCVALSENVCNRNQNIISCTGADNPPSCGTQPPPTEVGACSNPGGCPGDNFCNSQTELTNCSVSDPVDAQGQPVAGVTCSVTITEVP